MDKYRMEVERLKERDRSNKASKTPLSYVKFFLLISLPVSIAFMYFLWFPMWRGDALWKIIWGILGIGMLIFVITFCKIIYILIWDRNYKKGGQAISKKAHSNDFQYSPYNRETRGFQESNPYSGVFSNSFSLIYDDKDDD